MIPLIQRETAEKHKWVSDDEILEIIAIAESTPGPVAINSATFIGYKTAGVLGSVMATFGVVLPSFVIILIISFVLKQFQSIKAVAYAFNGIRAGVLALILKALVNMYKKCPKGWVSYTIFVFSFVGAVIFDINLLVVIVACAIFGLLTSYKARRDKA